MRGAHRGGVADDRELGVKGRDGDLKCGAGLGREDVIAFAVHEHVVIFAAAPDDGSHGLAIRDGQRAGRLDISLAGAACEGQLGGVGAVGQGEIVDGLAGFLDGNGVGDGDLVVVPRALLADECEVKFLVQRRNGDVEAEDLVREAVGIGNGVGGGLEQLGPFLFRVFLDAGEEVEDAGPEG